MSAVLTGYGTPEAYPALQSGKHRLGSAYVDEYQRRRLVATVAVLAREEGLSAATVSAITTRARISRKTFYDRFPNRADCIAHAGEEAVSYLFGPLAELRAERHADRRIEAGAGALVEAIVAEPNLAELALVHAPAIGGERGRRFQRGAVDAVATLLDGDPTVRAPGSSTIAGAIVGVLACWVRSGEPGRAGEVAEEVRRLASLREDPTPPRLAGGRDGSDSDAAGC